MTATTREPAAEARVERAERVRRVVVTGEGPILVEGPVEVVGPDGALVRSDREVVALCTCRRSRIAPFCDTSHRAKVRDRDRDADADRGGSRAGEDLA